jgi:hypothetical protein
MKPSGRRLARMHVYGDDLMVELEALAQARLGAHSGVAKDILRAAPRSESGLEEAIRTIREARIPFVDPLVVDYLAEDMETALAARSGRPAPRYGLSKPGVAADPTWTQWAPAAISCVAVLVVAGSACVAMLAMLALWL